MARFYKRIKGNTVKVTLLKSYQAKAKVAVAGQVERTSGHLTGYAVEIARDVAVAGAAPRDVGRSQSDVRLSGTEAA
jgi:hypothetical protein